MEKYILETFNSMIASMIGEYNTIKWQSHPIRSSDLPKEMTEQIQVLESIEFCLESGINPNVTNLISVQKSRGIDEEIAKSNLKLFSDYNSHSPQDTVKTTSAILSEWLKQHHVDRAIKDVVDIWENSSGTPEERISEIEEIIRSVKPTSDSIEMYSQSDMYDNFIEDLIRRRQDKLKYGEVGPTLPYEACDAYFSRLKFQEISSLMAESGFGKTMVMMDIAEFIAWSQDFPCDVVVLLLETPPVNIQQRQFAKKALMPYKLLESGDVDIEDEKYKKVFEKFKKKYVMRNETGRIHYIFLPEPYIDLVIQVMELHHMLIEPTGRRIVYMIDYLQKIQPQFSWQAQKQHQFYEQCTERIASKTRTLNAHSIIMVQENPDTGDVFGSKTIRQKSQLLMSLKRFPLESEQFSGDKPVQHKGKVVKDAMGNDRFWHREGDQLSSRAELHFVKANDAPRFIVNLRVEGAMGIVSQDPGQIKKMRESGLLTTRRKKRTI